MQESADAEVPSVRRASTSPPERVIAPASPPGQRQGMSSLRPTRTAPKEDKMTEQVPSSPSSVATQIFDALKGQDLDAVMALEHPDVVDDFVVLGRLEGRQARLPDRDAGRGR